jgi:hypothetical protein
MVIFHIKSYLLLENVLRVFHTGENLERRSICADDLQRRGALRDCKPSLQMFSHQL